LTWHIEGSVIVTSPVEGVDQTRKDETRSKTQMVLKLLGWGGQKVRQRLAGLLPHRVRQAAVARHWRKSRRQ
jgi:hypothetical protein